MIARYVSILKTIADLAVKEDSKSIFKLVIMELEEVNKDLDLMAEQVNRDKEENNKEKH